VTGCQQCRNQTRAEVASGAKYDAAHAYSFVDWDIDSGPRVLQLLDCVVERQVGISQYRSSERSKRIRGRSLGSIDGISI
jgi:hypothetical protein